MHRSRPARPEATEPHRAAIVPQSILHSTPDLLLKRLHWRVLRPLAHALGGAERSLVRGAVLELDELREYQPGDDVRHIDWNVTARTEVPFVRQSRVDRALDVWFVLDVSASVDWGTALCTKRDRLIEFVVVVSLLLGRHGNRVGAVLFDQAPLGFVPPAAGRPHLLRLIEHLDSPQRRGKPGPTDLTAALIQASTVIRRRALVLIVSDFLVPPGWQDGLRLLTQRHDVVAVQLVDPRERELPDVGCLTFEDPETSRQLIIDTGDRRMRERYARAAQEQAAQIKSAIDSAGADHLILSTAEELLPTMTKFLTLRRQRRGLTQPSPVTALG